MNVQFVVISSAIGEVLLDTCGEFTPHSELTPYRYFLVRQEMPSLWEHDFYSSVSHFIFSIFFFKHGLSHFNFQNCITSTILTVHLGRQCQSWIKQGICILLTDFLQISNVNKFHATSTVVVKNVLSDT